MPRPNKPCYRADRDSWVSTIDGRQMTLARGKRNRPEAQRALHRILAERKQPEPPAPKLVVLCDLFIEYCEFMSLTKDTIDCYHNRLRSFLQHVGRDIQANLVRPHHVVAWMASHKWNETTQHAAITAVKRLYSWAKQQGHAEDNPLWAMKRPRALSREVIPRRGDVKAILDALPQGPFRDLLVILDETGCRPSEAARIEAAMFDPVERTVVMKSKTTRRTGKPRIIYLSPLAVEVLCRLATKHPSGPLLRNARGRAWTRHSMAARFHRARKKAGVGDEMTAGALRHLFCTDGLEQEISIHTMAELLGHESPTMISRHYSHLRDRHEYLRAAANKVRPGRND